nr:hypothetical protein HK105_003866 [Polyrhizophydium stewartii]
MDSIPIGAWAAWLLNQLWTIESQVWAGFQALIIVNQICLAAFYIDIFIKWIDDFSSYWKDGWNIADAVITGIVSVPEVISWTKIFPHLSDQNDFFTAIRVLSVFKLIMRFETFKIIIMTIIQAVNSMGSIMLFVFMVVLTYSVIGTSFYSDYTHSVRADLFYQDFFRCSLVTRFLAASAAPNSR